MSEFKGTKGKLELKYASGICIGIGTVGNPSQITANSIIQHIETDKQYNKEKLEIESNMLLYSKAPEMLEMLKKAKNSLPYLGVLQKEVEQLIKQVTEL